MNWKTFNGVRDALVRRTGIDFDKEPVCSECNQVIEPFYIGLDTIERRQKQGEVIPDDEIRGYVRHGDMFNLWYKGNETMHNTCYFILHPEKQLFCYAGLISYGKPVKERRSIVKKLFAYADKHGYEAALKLAGRMKKS